MALGEDGRFGDTFTKPTTVPMLLDRAVVFDVSGIDTAEQILQAGVQLVCWSYGQSAVSAAKELADAGLREQTVYLMVMDELWRTLKASVEMVDRVDEITPKPPITCTRWLSTSTPPTRPPASTTAPSATSASRCRGERAAGDPHHAATGAAAHYRPPGLVVSACR